MALYAVNFPVDPFSFERFRIILTQSAIYVLGGDASETFNELRFIDHFKLISKLIALIIPTLLLGALVYKVIKPQTSLIVFPKKLALDCERSSLETCYYIATNSDIFDLKTKTFVKYYKPILDNGEPNPYPLLLVELEERTLPKPFSFVPTRVTIPVEINPSTSDNLEQPIRFIIQNNEIKKLYVDGQAIDADKGEFCQILVVVEALVPDLQTTLVECKIFYAHEDIAVQSAPIFDTTFDKANDKYIISNWEDFESV
jgi:hypothetical protein